MEDHISYLIASYVYVAMYMYINVFVNQTHFLFCTCVGSGNFTNL